MLICTEMHLTKVASPLMCSLAPRLEHHIGSGFPLNLKSSKKLLSYFIRMVHNIAMIPLLANIWVVSSIFIFKNETAVNMVHTFLPLMSQILSGFYLVKLIKSPGDQQSCRKGKERWVNSSLGLGKGIKEIFSLHCLHSTRICGDLVSTERKDALGEDGSGNPSAP